MTKEEFDAARQADAERYAELMRAKTATWSAEAEARTRYEAMRRSGEKADMGRIPTIEEALAPAYDATREALKASRIEAAVNPPQWVHHRLPPNDALIVAARARDLNPYQDEIDAMRAALQQVQK